MVILFVLLGAWLTGMVGLSYHILKDVVWSNHRDAAVTVMILLAVAAMTLWMFNSNTGTQG